MKIVVTGGAGFIGSNFVHYLVKQRPDWDITVVDALTYAGNLSNIASLVDEGSITFVRADITDTDGMQALFAGAGVEMVFHLAAESHVDRSIESAAEFVKTNVLGTQVMLTTAMANGVRRFVHISTDEVYGSLGPTGVFTEETPLDPTSPYASSKAASDLMALAACKTHGFDVVVTRCTNNYGPYQFPEKLIPLFISNALEDKKLPLYGDGTNVRSWIYVDDHSSALLAVAEHGVAGEVYNIGGPADGEIQNRIVTETILDLLNKPDSLIEFVTDRPAHDLRYAVSTDKIERELGWKPTVSFADGMAATVRWYLDNQDWWREIKSGVYQDYYARHYGNRGTAKEAS
jgi:dTDP-glucose 4,6-dehydratase